MRAVLCAVLKTIFVLSVAQIGPAYASDPSTRITVFWGNDRLKLQGFWWPEDKLTAEDKSVTKKPVVDCYFEGAKTKCFKLRKRKMNENVENGWEAYGTNMRFVVPIARLPWTQEEVDEAEADPTEEDEAGPDTNAMDDPKVVEKLPEFKWSGVPKDTLSSVLNGAGLAGSTQSYMFADSNWAVGGKDALEFWKAAVGSFPTRECFAPDSCSVVVKARLYEGNEAFALCSIQNTSIGLGIPYNCDVVSYREDGRWYVASYAGPEQCDGCGAGAGAECTAKTGKGLDIVAAAVKDALKKGRTNITLDVVKQKKDEIALAGKNIATPSRFYKNYFDKSYATYSISNTEYEEGSITVTGLFNLLVSSSPSKDGIDYREIGTNDDRNDLEWFQGQVLSIVKDALAGTGGKEIYCEVMSVE